MENVENNAKKRLILASLIIVMSIIIIGLSLSYAYYLNQVVEVNKKIKKQALQVVN